jgi:hypothetical protein
MAAGQPAGAVVNRCLRPIAAAICLGVLPGAANVVRADDFIVYSPYVMAGKSEVELRGFQISDGREDQGGSAAEMSISYGVNDWWKPEVYLLEYAKSPDASGRLQGFEFENTFQLTTPGEYFADFGFLASYGHSIVADERDTVEFGPLMEVTSGRFAHVVNLIWEKQVGSGAARNYEFRYSYSGTYAFSKAVHAGIEAYGRPADSAYQAGPIVSGEWHLPGTSSNLGYRVGVMLGINSSAPRQTWLAQLEYEFF